MLLLCYCTAMANLANTTSLHNYTAPFFSCSRPLDRSQNTLQRSMITVELLWISVHIEWQQNHQVCHQMYHQVDPR